MNTDAIYKAAAKAREQMRSFEMEAHQLGLTARAAKDKARQAKGRLKLAKQEAKQARRKAKEAKRAFAEAVRATEKAADDVASLELQIQNSRKRQPSEAAPAKTGEARQASSGKAPSPKRSKAVASQKKSRSRVKSKARVKPLPGLDAISVMPTPGHVESEAHVPPATSSDSTPSLDSLSSSTSAEAEGRLLMDKD